MLFEKRFISFLIRLKIHKIMSNRTKALVNYHTFLTVGVYSFTLNLSFPPKRQCSYSKVEVNLVLSFIRAFKAYSFET